MHSLLNPYIAGAPIVEPSMFFGRQDVFQWIERNLSGKFVDHILVIHGQRRVGKTSVLKQIPNFLPKTYIQVFFDLQGRTSTTLERFLWWMAREVARVLRQSQGLAVSVPEQEAFGGDGDYLVAQFLPGLQPILGEHKLLLTFDEFDTLEQPEIRETLGRPLIETLRRMFELEGLNFIFSIGSSGRKLENMQASYTDFFKTALYRKISFLSREDCLQLVARPVEGVLDYDPRAIERIYAVTGGHPYFTQLVCHELFSLCQKTGKRLLGEGDVDAILDDVIERGTVNLKFTWDEASSLEKWVLACLAQAEGAISMAELSRSLQAQRVRYLDPDLNAALNHLREKDILTEGNRFVVYLLHRWLQKNRPLDRVREELVEVNPIANRYIEIGEEYRTIGQVKKAIESFQQALVVDSQNLRAQVNIASIQLEQKDYPAAAQAFEKALAIDDEDVTARTGVCDAYLALGEAAASSQDMDQAKGYYQRVLEVNGEHNEARQRLAELYCQQAEAALAQGNDDEALAALGEALRFTPEDEALQGRCAQVQELKREKALAVVLEKSQVVASEGRWDQAIAFLEETIQGSPGEPRLLEALESVRSRRRRAQLDVLHQQAQRAASAEQWEAAQQAWRDYLALAPEDATQAVEALQHAEVQGELARAYQEAQLALEKKDYIRAVGLLKKVVLQDETYKDSARLLALAIQGQRKRRKVFVLPKWAVPALAGAALLAIVVFLGARFGPSWMEGLKRTPVIQTPVTTAAVASLETPGGTAQLATGPLETPGGTPQPAWVGEFANPILQSIQARPPNFEDDFSTAKAEWDTLGGQPIGNLVTDGVLRVGSGGLGAPILNTPDFALQFDFLHQTDTLYKFGFRFRNEGDGGNYGLYFQGGSWVVYVQEAAQGPYITLAGEDKSSEIVPGQWTRVLLIAYGDGLAVFLNGKPAAYIRDSRVQGDKNFFGFDEGTKTLDNIKFWRLAPPPAAAATTGVMPGAGRKVCVVDDANSSIDDKGYGQNTWKGVQDAMQKLGVQGKYLDAQQQSDYPKYIEASVAEGCDLIVTVGFLLSEDTQKAADAHPQQKFHLVGASLDPPKANVLGQHFETRAGAFLAGYLAAALSKTGKAGTLGGLPLPPVIDYMNGFAQGVAYYNQQKAANVQVLGWDPASQTGAFVGDFTDKAGYKAKAAELIGAGADILMPVGPPSNGAEVAAKAASGVLLIGVDWDVYEIAPDYREILLTSVKNNFDVLTFSAIQNMVDGSFAGGTLEGSLENGGVSLAPFHDLESRVPASLRGEIEQIKADIIAGKIQVSSSAQPAVEGGTPVPDLTAIQGKPPDFEDDFTRKKPEWGLDKRGSKIADGVMTLVVQESGQNANAGGNHLTASDFVLEFDFQRTSQDCNDCALVVSFRGTDQSWYNLDLSLGPGVMEWRVVKFLNGVKEEIHRGAILIMDPPASHHYKLVAQGDAFWFYLDQELVTYWQDASLTGSKLNIGSRNEGGTSWIQVDNLKFWNLDPAWAKEMRSRPPDFQDDFSSLKPDWKKNKYIGSFQVTDGVLQLQKNSMVGDYSLQALDYVFQSDLRLNEIDENTSFLYSLRLTEYENGKYGTEYVLKIFPSKKMWEFSVIKDPKGQYQQIQAGDLKSFEAGQWIRLTVAVSGDSVWIYWDGELLLHYQGLELTGEVSHLGVSTESDTVRLELDNWKFWKLK